MDTTSRGTGDPEERVAVLSYAGGDQGSFQNWTWGDGAVALSIGCGTLGACFVAALLIALAMNVGRM